MKEHDMLIEARKLEEACADLIREFCERTGVSAERVDVEVQLLQAVGRNHTMLTGFKVEVVL